MGWSIAASRGRFIEPPRILAQAKKRLLIIDTQTDIPHNKIKVRGKGESHAEGDSAEDRAMDRSMIINVTGILVDQE